MERMSAFVTGILGSFRECTEVDWYLADHQHMFTALTGLQDSYSSCSRAWLSRSRQWTLLNFFPQIFSGIYCVASPGSGPLPLPSPSPAIARLHSPLASRQHLALYNLTKHFETPLQLAGAHVAGEISNIYHTAFALLKKGDTEGPSHYLASWSPFGGGLQWSPRPQSMMPD